MSPTKLRATKTGRKPRMTRGRGKRVEKGGSKKVAGRKRKHPNSRTARAELWKFNVWKGKKQKRSKGDGERRRISGWSEAKPCQSD